ncbi:hypothetical protein BN1321_350005 [Staphylococcus aureus]|uniref:Uncharacterized protein n=1 Tax=Staphylococcus aureus TaxID=1280 RepID=A0A0U1MR34_STAAU|nr:hypothetical protein BN1321_350005 [Staphylococcus aureus]
MIKIVTNSLTYLATYFAYKKTYLHTLCNKNYKFIYDTTMLAYLYSAIDTHF